MNYINTVRKPYPLPNICKKITYVWRGTKIIQIRKRRSVKFIKNLWSKGEKKNVRDVHPTALCVGHVQLIQWVNQPPGWLSNVLMMRPLRARWLSMTIYPLATSRHTYGIEHVPHKTTCDGIHDSTLTESGSSFRVHHEYFIATYTTKNAYVLLWHSRPHIR